MTQRNYPDLCEFDDGDLVHNTDSGGDWWQQTYLHQDGDIFTFTQYNPGGRSATIHNREELKEHVAKLIPILFTPEELKKLLAPK